MNHYPTNDTNYSLVVDVSKEEFERFSNEKQTPFERQENDNETMFERDLNVKQTILKRQENENEKEKRRRQTAAATNENKDKPAITPSDFVNNNPEVIKLLNNKKFVKQVLGRGDLKYIFSLPDPIKIAINQKLHTNYTDYELNKIHLSNQYNKRVPRWKVKVLCVFIAIFSVYLTSVYYKATTTSQPTKEIFAASIIGSTSDYNSLVAEFEHKNRFTFYPYRKDIVIKELSASNADNYENILQTNMAAQKQAIAKNKKK